MFRQWNPSRPSQAPRKVKDADWTDPSKPAFTGTTQDTPSGVLDVFTKYYSALFAHKPACPHAQAKCLLQLCSHDDDGTLRNVLRPTKDACDAPVTANEIATVMNELPTGKSPGPDRLPNKFYKTYSELLSQILEYVFTESVENGALPPYRGPASKA